MTFVNCSLGQRLLEPLHTFSANENECYLFGGTFLNIHPFVYHIDPLFLLLEIYLKEILAEIYMRMFVVALPITAKSW